MVKRILVFLFFFHAALFYAQDFSDSSPFQITNQGEESSLIISFPDFFSSEIASLVRTGVPIKINYDIRINKKGFFGGSFSVPESGQLYRSIQYDISDNSYVLILEGIRIRKKELKEAIRELYRPAEIKLSILLHKHVQPGDGLKCRLTMESIRLYPPLSLVFNMLPIYNFKTLWQYFPLDEYNE